MDNNTRVSASRRRGRRSTVTGSSEIWIDEEDADANNGYEDKATDKSKFRHDIIAFPLLVQLRYSL